MFGKNSLDVKSVLTNGNPNLVMMRASCARTLIALCSERLLRKFSRAKDGSSSTLEVNYLTFKREEGGREREVIAYDFA